MIYQNTQTGQFTTAPIDGKFQNNQGYQIFTNLYATLYGSAGSAGVPVQLSSDHEVALYPNPAATILNIPAALRASGLELHDMLGRTVLRSSESNPEHVDVRSLTSGSYLAFIHTETGIITAPIIIAR
jgi:hypothetical protein